MGWRSFARSCGRGVLAALPVLLSASHADAERLPIKIYTTADGLSQNQVNRIVRDSRGFLWFCTREGLSRFDGHAFVSYTQSDGLPHRSVRDIVESRDGEYWIATREGLVRWRPGVVASVRGGGDVQGTAKRITAFEVFSPANSDLARDVWRLFRDPSGTIWVGTVAGLFRIETANGDVRFAPIDLGMPATRPDTHHVQDIQMDRTGALWVAARGSGIYRRRPDGRVVRYTDRDGLPEVRVNVLQIDRENHVWAGTPFGLARLAAKPDSDDFAVDRVFTKRSGLAGDWINALWEGPDATMWVGGAGGLTAILESAGSSQQIRTYAAAEGIIDDEVSALIDDGSGNLWIGTASSGALKLAQDGLTQYDEADGIGTEVIGGLFTDPRAGVCVYDYRQVAVFDGRRFIRIPLNFGRAVRPSPWSWGRVALRDSAGAFWFATADGLYRFPSVRRIADLSQVRPEAIYDAHHGLPADRTLMLYEDRRADIWIFSDSGWHPALTRWRRTTGEFHRVSQAEGWPPDMAWISDFGEDGAGNLWIAGSSLVRYRDGRFRRLTTADGLPADVVSSVHIDQAGRLWLATDAAGVMRVDDPSAERLSGRLYSTATGLASDQTFTISEDKSGRIYVVTGRGVDRLDAATGAIRHYTSAEGLVFGPLSLRDADGGLWFGSARHLSRLLPAANVSPAPPSAWISNVSVEGLPEPIPNLGAHNAGSLSLNSTDRQISVEFFGIGEGLQYQYRLGAAGDAKWSMPADQRTVHYASLSPGRYQFEVRAVSADSGLASSPATIAFVIPPPIWLRWWFLTLGLAAIALTLYGLHRRRVAHLVEVERVRTRIATDLHDDLGANLSRVAILSEVVKQRLGETDAHSVSLLAEIADSSRSLMGSLRDLVWAIDPVGGSVGDLETRVRHIAGTLLDPKGVAWTLQRGDDDSRCLLDAEQRRHMMLFFKEGINNAARYAEASRVDLSIEHVRQLLICRINDNGRGFDISVAPAHGGRGLRNMRARAAALGGRLDILSTPGAGTSLILTVPLTRKVLGA